MKPVRLGIAGLGTATRLMLAAFVKNDSIQICAAASTRPGEREAFARDFGVSVYEDLDNLCQLDSLDAIYISTPTHLHVEHVLMAVQSGKHVLVEKPLAVNLEDARRIVTAVEDYRRVVVVGHSHSFDPPIQAMRQVIASGRLGELKMVHNWFYTDWLYRPRLPDELQTALGGGVTFRQGAHQFDIIRYLGGGRLHSVRAVTGRWDESRPTEGSHTAFLTFESGAVATAVYSGTDHFQSSELTFGIDEWGHEVSTIDTSGTNRRRLQQLTPDEELRLKRASAGYQSIERLPQPGPHQPFFGVTLVSCERGDIRQSPHGLLVYGDDGVSEIALPRDVTPHDNVVSEFCDAVVGRRTAVHTPAWGLATLEVCLAVLESSRTQQEVYLHYQESCEE